MNLLSNLETSTVTDADELNLLTLVSCIGGFMLVMVGGLVGLCLYRRHLRAEEKAAPSDTISVGRVTAAPVGGVATIDAMGRVTPATVGMEMIPLAATEETMLYNKHIQPRGNGLPRIHNMNRHIGDQTSIVTTQTPYTYSRQPESRRWAWVDSPRSQLQSLVSRWERKPKWAFYFGKSTKADSDVIY